MKVIFKVTEHVRMVYVLIVHTFRNLTLDDLGMIFNVLFKVTGHVRILCLCVLHDFLTLTLDDLG